MKRHGVSARIEYDVQTQTWLARINGQEYRGASFHGVVIKIENAMRRTRGEMIEEAKR